MVLDKNELLKFGRFCGLSYAIELVIGCVCFGHVVLFLVGFIRRRVCGGRRLEGIFRFVLSGKESGSFLFLESIFLSIRRARVFLHED